MRSLLGTTALVALLALSGVARAQTSTAATEAVQEAGSLSELQRSLMQMTERLREAPHGGSTNLEQTAADANELLAAVREQVGTMPQTQRPDVQSAIQQAQQALEGENPATMAAAMETVQAQVEKAASADAGVTTAGGDGPKMAQQPASAAERETMDEGSETAVTQGQPGAGQQPDSQGQAATVPPTEAAPAQPSANTDQQSQLAGMSVDEVIGDTVYTSAGEEIGTISDVVADVQDQTAAFVVGIGGFLGIGEQDVAIPLRELAPEGDRFVTRLGRSQIEGLPEYDEGGFQSLDRNQALGSYATR